MDGTGGNGAGGAVAGGGAAGRDTAGRDTGGRDTVSIVIVARDAAALLPGSVAAVLAQTPPPREIIVVDDGSRDALAAVASRLPVRTLHDGRRGTAAARNAGLRCARGELVLFLTAGDGLPPGTLAALSATLRAAPAAVMAVAAGPLPDGAILWRRAALAGAGGFRTAAGPALDLDAALRLGRGRTAAPAPGLGTLRGHCLRAALRSLLEHDARAAWTLAGSVAASLALPGRTVLPTGP